MATDHSKMQVFMPMLSLCLIKFILRVIFWFHYLSCYLHCKISLNIYSTSQDFSTFYLTPVRTITSFNQFSVLKEGCYI